MIQHCGARAAAVCALLFATVLRLSASNQHDGSQSTRFSLFPAGHHIPVFKANIEEPRLGYTQFINRSASKLDVGNTVDVFNLDIPSASMRFSFGVDFMAYGFVTSMHQYRLQIDAIDGLYGGNFSFSKRFTSSQLQARLRLLHHSAHFADGAYDFEQHRWLARYAPLPFSRNFAELTLAQVFTTSFAVIRPYAGASYAGFVRPSILPREYYLAGFELSTDHILGSIGEEPLNLFVASHVSMYDRPTHIGATQLMGGIKVGQWFGKGATVYVSYYNGKHIFAEYLFDRWNSYTAGVTFDFF
jgi:hypothetical protein